MYLLDSDTGIAVLRGRPRRPRVEIEARLRNGELVSLAAAAAFEMRYGIYHGHGRPDQLERLEELEGRIPVVAFDALDADAAARAAASLARRGLPIGPYDVLIAGQALARDLTLVTGNTREFGRVEGLRVEDWLHD